jgi:6-pyruvoyltetrahydropterin/6-carboxytetrahydropterin synthase
MFKSTKTLELGSCAFRQPEASHSHCRFIHGYKLSGKFWFEAKELDKNHWVFDFGGLRGLKEILKKQFDHTTCIAADDPVLPIFQTLVAEDACDLRIMPNGTGVERIAEWCFEVANAYVDEFSDGRCKCIKVEIFEHENNSAIYSTDVTVTPPVDNVNQTELNFEEPVKKSVVKKEPQITQPPFKVKDSGISSNDTKQVNTWVDPNASKNSWLF